MKSKTFYVLDLGLSSPEDFATKHKCIEARSPEGAAEEWGGAWEECHDDMTGECLVADNPEGLNALRIEVRCAISVDFHAKVRR